MAALALGLPEGQPVARSVFRTPQDQDIDAAVLLPAGQVLGQSRAPRLTPWDNARLQLTYARITAPLSGRIGLRLVDVGNIVHATDQNGLLTITQLQPIAVLFTIPADNLPPVLAKLRAGAKLRVAPIHDDGSLDVRAFEALLGPRTRIVATMLSA